MFGLRINYRKSTLIPFGCDEAWKDEVKDELHCLVLKLPIIYLGIPLGANLKKEETWKPILVKIEKRVASWKAKLLSRARRLVLIKAVPNSLPLYYLSSLRFQKR